MKRNTTNSNSKNDKFTETYMSIYLSKNICSLIPEMKAKDLKSVGDFINRVRNQEFDPSSGQDVSIHSKKGKLVTLGGFRSYLYL